MRWPVVAIALAACGDNGHARDYLSYTWDERRVLCSDAVDDLSNPVNWKLVERQIAQAQTEGWVVMFHAHTPGVTVTRDALARVLQLADDHGLDYVTFDELVATGERRPGLALAFDDNAPDQWMTVRDLLSAHHARVTFFVSRWATMTAPEHDELAVLAGDGHALEPHTVHHLHAKDYVAQHGLDAYIADEVLPSIQVLTDAGYQPASFAYPFGEHDPEIDAAVLEHIDRVRTTPGECPY